MTEQDTLSFAAGFSPATREDWRKLVDRVLKGAPFERLQSQTYDGLMTGPLYDRSADARAVAGRVPGRPWAVMQRGDHPNPAAANAQALDDLHDGATGLALAFAGSVSANGFGLDSSAAAIARMLEGVALDAGICVEIDLAPFAREVPQRVADAIRQRIDPAAANIRFGYDPITAVAISGKMPLPWTKTAPLMAGLIRTLADGGFRGPFAVADGRVIHNAGGSEAQELGFVLAGAVAYLRALEASGLTLEHARDAIYFRLSADAEQFLTMAKFRAVRKLWGRVEAACGLAPKPAVVVAETAWRMLAQRDTHVNILRNAIAIAAAGLGGADAVTVVPHTAALGLPDAFARRIARNTQLVLLEESNLARVADPGAGAGALEAMTEQLCAAAWSLFQDIEKAGGASAALESGLVQRYVAAVRGEREKSVAFGKDTLTGVNAYPDIHETAPAVLDVAPPAPPEIAAAMTTVALPRIRLASPFEALRDASDRILAATGARPKIFLATLGTPTDFSARTTYARNFFETGGIEAISSAGPNLGSTFRSSGTVLACLCSSDKVYENEAAAAAAALKAAGARHIYLAGRPGKREEALRGAGIQSFIHDGCDALATLTAAYDILDGKSR